MIFFFNCENLIGHSFLWGYRGKCALEKKKWKAAQFCCKNVYFLHKKIVMYACSSHALAMSLAKVKLPEKLFEKMTQYGEFVCIF